jgi:TolA-binding protein
MKKILIAITLCSLFLCGCADDRYATEKRWWNTQKQAERIFKNPEVAPPKQVNDTLKLLNAFIERYPQSPFAVTADFTIARIYIVKKDYDKGRAYLRSMIAKYQKFDEIISTALFTIGSSYEIENKWPKALEQYNKIIQDYPLTQRGLALPVYIAQHYKINYQPDKMVAAFQTAISHYKALADKYPDSPLGLNARNIVSQCFIAIKDWQGALANLNAMASEYKSRVQVDGIIFDMALIHYKQLNDPVKAKQLLQKLISEYPKSRLIQAANKLLKEME